MIDEGLMKAETIALLHQIQSQNVAIAASVGGVGSAERDEIDRALKEIIKRQRVLIATLAKH